MATANRKDDQFLVIFHLFAAISRVTLGEVFSNLAVL